MIFQFVAAAVGIGSALLGAKASRDQAKLQRQQMEQQRRQQELQFRRSQREALRQAQIQRAQIRSAGAAAGALGGSAVSGAMGSVSSQLGTQLGYATQMSGISNRITDLGIAANAAGSRAQTFGAISQLAFASMPYAESLDASRAAPEVSGVAQPQPARSIYE